MTGRIIAHRGMSRLAPENTLAAFRMMAEHGVQWLECDVDLLGDGTAVLLHDTQLDRTTDRSGTIADLTRSDLEHIDAGSWFSPAFAGERIPTLDQLIDLLNALELNANIELKSPVGGAAAGRALVDTVLKALDRLDPDRRIILSSFNHLLIRRAADQLPGGPAGARIELACLFTRATLREDWRTVIEMAGAGIVHPQDRGLTRAEVETMRAAGFDVNVWTVNDPARANQLLNWGATGICTDVAHLLIRGSAGRRSR
ncbi:glycerophosphoryl diester phosphodiesterase [Helcobacillus massiliensis]|uniref:glycerophosphoryl diester phosphodiesterase n=1 Tax=Helcobacillus massiliensis TaxID=521392 RepID=UPI0025540C33|nr:glycerophosphoryl diester phosphodiesterase [Helcobacillus massiliensis]MDK7742220.1 glycerophosphoryl diester phosphodiesterase [Helcobacillus massiliensis]WOO93772.1 glycerophosphoryl diester phosphodiesterase [Helcobacillus massiliensis]